MEEKKLYNAVRKIITLADGRQIEIETGKLAKQADGSVVVKMGDTMLLGTVVAAKDAKPDTDFMPLQVEYKEKYAACGRYPGGFMKREGKANDSEVLVARLIDRALRPLFPADYHAEVYVTVNLISADKDIQPDALAGLAASAALAVSDIPFGGPISEVRVARIDGNYVINPNYSEMGKVDLDIMVGDKRTNLRIENAAEYEFDPRALLQDIIKNHIFKKLFSRSLFPDICPYLIADDRFYPLPELVAVSEGMYILPRLAQHLLCYVLRDIQGDCRAHDPVYIVFFRYYIFYVKSTQFFPVPVHQAVSPD